MIGLLAAIVVVALVQLTLHGLGVTAATSYVAAIAAGSAVLYVLGRRRRSS